MKIRTRIRRLAARLAGPEYQRRALTKMVLGWERDGLLRALETYTTDRDQLRIDKDRFDDYGGPRTRRIKSLEALQEEMFHLTHVEPTVIGVLEHLRTLIAGNGVHVKINPEQIRRDGRRAAEAWAEFDDAVGYSGQGGMIGGNVFNALALGEWFTVWMPPEGVMDSPERPAYAVAVMGMDPITTGHIKQPIIKGGQIVGYERRGVHKVGEKILPAHRVTHWKGRVMGQAIRGRPLLEAAWDDILRLRQSRQTSWMQQEFRKRLMTFIYQITDPKLADDLPDEFSLPNPLSILEVPAGAKVEIPDMGKAGEGGTAGRGWGDVGGIRGTLMGLAQTASLPIHLTQNDYREGTYAGLGQADGPLSKTAEWWQGHFTRYVIEDVQKVTGEEDARGEAIVPDVSFPPVVMRDNDERRMWLDAYEMGVVSLETCHDRMGIDHEQEMERMGLQQDDMTPDEPGERLLVAVPGSGSPDDGEV